VNDSPLAASDALAVARMDRSQFTTSQLTPEQEELDYFPPEKIWS
jgi:hypothetical protein